MRNWCWLLISLTGAAAAEPPPRLKLAIGSARRFSRLLVVEKDGTRYEQVAIRISP